MYMTRDEFLELFESSSNMKECISDYWEDWFALNDIDTDEENKYGGRKKSTKEYNKRREIKRGQYSFDMMTYAVIWVRAKDAEKRYFEKRREFSAERIQYSDTIKKLKQEIEDLKTNKPQQETDYSFLEDSGDEEEGAGVGFDDGESSAVSEVSEPEKTPQEIYEEKLAKYEEHLDECKRYELEVNMEKPVPP